MHAIIAGTGIYNIPHLNLKRQVIETPYGDALVFIGQGDDADIVFLTRHGANHSVPPHKVNYRANIKALDMLGVKRIIANYAVGGISPHIKPLDLAVITDILDFTKHREHTFIEGGEKGVDHVEMSVPYCPVMSAKLLELAPQHNLELHPESVYVAANGPRFETPAEIRMYGMLGGDVVGMTGMPEVSLARELGMCFGAVALSINWAAGIQKKIEVVYDGLPELRANLLKLCVATLRAGQDSDCEPAQMI